MIPFVMILPVRVTDAILLPFRLARDFWMWLDTPRGNSFGWILTWLMLGYIFGSIFYKIWN